MEIFDGYADIKNTTFLSCVCHGARYITHFYCLAVEAGFYSDVVECLPVDPATWVQFPAGTGKIFSLYDMSSDWMSEQV